MANINKVDIPIAVSHQTKLDLSCNHVTTQDFMTQRPVYYRHMIKDEHININALATIRPMPLATPTYGRMRMNLRAFFCPFSLVFPNFNSFYTDVIASNYGGSSLVPDSPVVTNGVLFNCFSGNTVDPNSGITYLAFATQLDPTDPDDANAIAAGAYDFLDLAGDYFIFTDAGLRWYTLLRSLGYQINWQKGDDTPYSALPLLCYARVVLDWYTNSQYLDSASVLKLEQLLRYNDPTSYLSLTEVDIHNMAEIFTTVVYDTDNYFNNAWDNPMAPNSGQYSSYTIQDIGLMPQSGVIPADHAKVRTAANGSMVMERTAGTNTVSIGSEYLHQALAKMQSFQKRHALAGARAIDRWLAQYGKGIPNYDRSIYVGSQSIDINVGDIMSTANTAAAGQPSTLGDFAGRSFGQGSKAWDFTCSEFGLFIVISSILPDSEIYQGFDRNNMHLSKTQFFQPEFDSMAVSAIQKREVYVSNNGAFGSGADYDGVFGFTGAYGEYKRPLSWASGLIVCPSRYLGADAWHLFRKFNDNTWSNSIANLKHSLNFTRGTDRASYHRIFTSTDPHFDPFIIFYHFDVGVHAPCRPLFETYDFEEETKKITLDTGGTKVN